MRHVAHPVRERYERRRTRGSHRWRLTSHLRPVPAAEAGDLYSCGWDSHGQLGSGGETADLRINRALPNAVDLPDETGVLSADVAVAQAAAGSAHSAVLTTDGRLVTFGFGTMPEKGGAQDRFGVYAHARHV